MSMSPSQLRHLTAFLGNYRSKRAEHVLHACQTMFGPTRIFETTDKDGLTIRVLEVDGAWESATYISEGYAEPVFEYHRLYNRLFEARPMATDFLMLGAGGFSYPKYLLAHTHDTTIDAVEIDPEVVSLAKRWFYLERARAEFDPADTRLRIFTEDAAGFLRGEPAARKAYDVILNDVFGGDSPDGELATAEGVRLVRSHLAKDGLYVLNVVSALEGPRAAALEQASSALTQEFAHVYLIACSPDEPTIKDNNVLIACDDACRFTGAVELGEQG